MVKFIKVIKAFEFYKIKGIQSNYNPSIWR